MFLSRAKDSLGDRYSVKRDRKFLTELYVDYVAVSIRAYLSLHSEEIRDESFDFRE